MPSRIVKYNSIIKDLSKSTIIKFKNKNIIKDIKENIIQVQTRKSLHIGINYIDTHYELRGCINDANNIANLIKSPNYGFNNKDVLIISDYTPIKPTKNNIINFFIRLMQTSQSGDVLLFSYSGHGLQTNKNSSETCLVSSDLKFITDSQLKNIINNFLPQDVTLFALIDACYSGTVFNLKYQYLNSLNNDENEIYLKESETKGQVVMISGSTDNQTSADSQIDSDIYEGAMTWSFLSTLKKIPKPSWYELINNMRTLLTESINSYTQKPQLYSGKPLNMKNIFSLSI
jgi:hypothetical protein